MFFAALTASSINETQKAIVDRPGILAKANEPVDLICKAPAGESGLNLCLWDRIRNGQREVIVVQEGVIQNEGQAVAAGISSALNGYQARQCGVNIRVLKRTKFRIPRCTLVTPAGNIFKGRLSIIDGNFYCLGRACRRA